MSQTISSSGHIRNGAVQTELMARDDTTITEFPKCTDMRRPSCWTIGAYCRQVEEKNSDAPEPLRGRIKSLLVEDI